MTNKRYFLLAGIFAFIGLVVMSCSVYDENYPPVTSISSATKIGITPSIAPSPTVLPTFTMQPSPTAMPPYPTASVVKANAVVFVEREYWAGNLSLWIVNVDGSGERKLTGIENNESQSSNYLLQWSPDGKWIGYISGDDLWIISPDGSIKRKILSIQDTDKKIIRVYRWSPDSSKIAYAQASDWGDRTSITIGLLDLVTGKISEIDSYQSPLTITLFWTPDGNHLLLSKDPSFLLFDINAQKFVKTKEIPGWHECTAWWYDQLFWSPNEQWFAYTFHGNGPYYNRWLCVSNLDGTVNYEINYSDVNGIYAIPPAWDKTGNYLYLVVRNYDDPPHPEIDPDLRLVRFNIKTRKIERLLSLSETEPNAMFWHISISPNGQTLEIDARISEKHQVYIMDLNSMSTTRFDVSEIPDNSHSFFEGAIWSADSRYIVFAPESYNYFYKLDTQTGESTIISGLHPIASWAVSPIATTP
ncbi:MAG: hypothetical protein HYR70_05140 [Chloroflexi bacterium]|nr:hypothetical protein [Chloroflexota bacterium]MBI3338567.1 hypothetical protein [Chloroflexota bacterium]